MFSCHLTISNVFKQSRVLLLGRGDGRGPANPLDLSGLPPEPFHGSGAPVPGRAVPPLDVRVDRRAPSGVDRMVCGRPLPHGHIGQVQPGGGLGDGDPRRQPDNNRRRLPPPQVLQAVEAFLTALFSPSPLGNEVPRILLPLPF